MNSSRGVECGAGPTTILFRADDYTVFDDQGVAQRAPAQVASEALAEVSDARELHRLRLESLTGLRAVAAFMVFVFHLQASGVSNPVTALGRWGYVGVSFFYLLSGVVLVYAYKDSQSDRLFWWFRAARVLPLYFVVLFAAWLINVAQGEGLDLAALAASALLIQAWIPDRDIYFGVQPVFWSLSVETFFYLCFPLVYRKIRPLRTGVLGRLAIALYLGVVVIALVGFPYEGFAVWLVYVAPPVRLLEFLIGVVLGEMLNRGVLPRVPGAAAIVSLAVGLALMAYAPPSFRPVAVTLVPFVLTIAWAYQCDLSSSSSPVASVPLVTAGTWSYAFYLIHPSVIGGSMKLFSGTNSYVVMAASLVVATIASGIAYRLLELPAQDYIRSIVKRRPVSAPTWGD